MRLFALSLLSTVALTAQSLPPGDLSVIPTPQQIQRLTGSFRIGSSVRIVLGERTLPADVEAAEALNEALVERSMPALKTVRERDLRSVRGDVVYVGHPESRRGKAVLQKHGVTFEPSMEEEGYLLVADADGVNILGASPKGRFYGVMTFVQLLRPDKRSMSVPGVLVRDRPMQRIRGITDDISRGQVSTMDDFRRIIRFLARYKMNVYSPYLEDMFVFSRHPAIGQRRGALTAAQMHELDVYARRYHVELIPIFETLGHWENILLLPEYRDLGEFPGAHTVNVSDERVFALLDEMIGEISAACASPWFNMGADESWDVGLGANRNRVASSDLATVHAEHYRRVADILRKHGKKPMMYGDIILDNPSILPLLPKDVVVVDWQYWAGDRYPSPSTFRDAKVPFIVSPAVYNFVGPFPNYVHTFVNIRNFALEGYRNGAVGLLTSNWNDYGGEALRPLNMYGYGWTAELGWNPERANADSFSNAFFKDFFGSAQAGRSARTAYALLSNPLNLISWHELWRHPMLPLRQAPLNVLWRIEGIRSSSPIVAEMLADVRSNAVRNHDHVRYLEFILRMNLWFASKLEAGESIRRLTQSPSPGSSQDSIRHAVVRLIDRIVPSLRSLQDEFRSLWLTTNHEAGLEWLVRRYERQAAYWMEKRDQVEHGELWVNPETPSAWLYHPSGNPGQRDSSLPQVRNAVFRRNFALPDTFAVASAWLQLIGDSHARVEVNGTSVGEVFARRSLSLIVEHDRVKAWDIARFLRVGDNSVVIRADSYAPFGSAGVNVWCRVDGVGGGVTVLHSDTTWQVRDVRSDETAWVTAKIVPSSLPVIAPSPRTGRWSWIER